MPPKSGFYVRVAGSRVLSNMSSGDIDGFRETVAQDDEDNCHLPSVAPRHVCRRAWFTGDMDFTYIKIKLPHWCRVLVPRDTLGGSDRLPGPS
jgi:hypothetical protein